MRYIHWVLWIVCLPVMGAELSLYQGAPLANQEGYQLQVGTKTYDLATLQRFPRYQSRFRTLWTTEGVFVGAKFIDVLKDAGINEYELLYLEALNDYAITLGGKEEGINTALIAWQKGGQLLPLSSKGPFWLVWPSLEESLLSRTDNGAVWIWNLDFIRKVR